jgi:2-dehydro-3-deoxyphosphogluconate aldolase/(4S)-4-hydroxy-2-oxoglutarate aldolase
MSTSGKLDSLLTSGVIAVVRATRSEPLVRVAEALRDGGVLGIEITFTVPKAVRVIEEVADALGDSIVLGAGTVLDAETARAAILAGAEYIVSPVVNLPTIELCKRYGKLVMPGALTPTEVLTAWQAGADIVKIFPSDVTGPAYLKALSRPLPQVRMMPTGGVDLNTAADFLKAGAVALGVGSSLVSQKAIDSEDWAGITELAKKYVSIVRDTRAQMGAT